MEQERRERNGIILEWFDALIFALVVVLALMMFFIRTVTVDGISMEPGLLNGDQIVLQSFLYTPRAGDVVVVDSYTSFGLPLVKRVIATGGDTVDIDFEEGVVYVNGQQMEEPYISAPTTRAYDIAFPLQVPEGKVFLMGDNRPYSKDSRHSDIGLIDERDLLGRAFFRIFPFRRVGPLT